MDPATISAAGSLLSGVGSLSSAFGGGNDGPGIVDANRKAIGGRIRGAVESGHKWGIHPLYALGAPAIGVEGQSFTGSRVGAGLAAAGEAMSGYASLKEARAEAARNERRQDMLVTAQTAESMAKARAATAQADRDYVESAVSWNAMKRAEAAANFHQDGLAKVPDERRAKDHQNIGPQPGKKMRLPFGLDWVLGDATPAQAFSDEQGEALEIPYGVSKVLSEVALQPGLKEHWFPQLVKALRKAYAKYGRTGVRFEGSSNSSPYVEGP